MIKPDWNVFKVKFSDDPRKKFEWLCYSLFCQEYDKHHGIFRYKNQSGIETNPITKDGEVIGWQAKFYDTPLKDHLDEFTEMLNKSKRDYPDITKIIVYTNLDWTKGTGQNAPKTLRTIEQRANDLSIEIDWRTASFFESPFVTVTNENIATHFFTLDKSVITLLQEKETHTELILYQIQTDIEFNTEKIEIDRIDVLKSIHDHLNTKQILILSGVGGVGKTAVIKKYYQQIEKKTPFYIFKANEFNLRNINDLFPKLELQDFIEAHREEENKIIVIDSAERLLDLQNRDPFKEFLSALIKNNWKLIFTTRNNYLEDLNYQFIQIYKIIPSNLNLQNLDTSRLVELSQKYRFILPDDKKLLKLIKNLFYLNEYLKFYTKEESFDYSNFKANLWNEVIKKSKPAREQCFLQVAFQRVKEAQFFVTPSCDSQILREFIQDGILGYETAGYFITHDIYEEWALEKIIQTAYIKKLDNTEFFDKIGEALPIRRSFRNWSSEKLLLRDESIKLFIEEVFDNEKIQSYWKDEILVSTLLSDYSETFFELFEEKMLENNHELLRRIVFLLRIACKEVDYNLLKRLEIENIDSCSIKYIYTKPKGKGWNSTIEYIYENLNEIGIENAHFVLPIIYDWNSKFNQGKTTKYSSLIALQYYQWIIQNKKYISHNDSKEKMFRTILQGSAEIKTQLSTIFEEVINEKWKKHMDPYSDLINYILIKCIYSYEVFANLPQYILKLADLFWFQIPEKEEFDTYSRIELEEQFCIGGNHQDYNPSSAFQTPIYWLLQYSFKETINFIINFTNRAVEYYVKYGSEKYEDGIEEVEVIIDNLIYKQYINDRLWNAYRGTMGSTYLLESIHMALEKFLLMRGKNCDPQQLEKLLLDLLKNSKSASITAVVTSIVLAYPDKTFNIAMTLFQTKQFLFYDTKRLFSEQNHKHWLLTLKNSYGADYKMGIYEDERIEACDDKHRKLSLENIILYYQLFSKEEIKEEEASRRKRIIWSILDEYYKNSPNKHNDTDEDKTWRLFLARMDLRKAKPTIEENQEGVLLALNPEIDSELREYSEKSVSDALSPMKYSSLRLWAKYKIQNDQRHQQYTQYENNPQLALKEVKEIVYTLEQAPEDTFYLFNYSIPAEVCSILLREYFGDISADDRIFCKEVVLNVACHSLQPNYKYQISDGTQSTLSVLPLLLQKFPEEKIKIKIILILTMFKDETFGMAGTEFNEFAIIGIDSIWSVNFKEAQSLLFGYLLLKPRYEALKKDLRYGKYVRNTHDLYTEVNQKFLTENEEDIKKVIENKISFDDLKNIEQLDPRILKTAFKIIPLNTDNNEHKIIAQSIISTFAKELLSNRTKKIVDYNTGHSFLKKLAYFTLSSSEQDIPTYLRPFIDNFSSSEAIADLFEEFIVAEYRLNSYNNFWKVWDIFYEKVVDLCKYGDKQKNVKSIVQSYLFAQTYWNEKDTDWQTLTDANRRFFANIIKKIGHCTSTLYSISKLLNGIGSKYLNNGISWISEILTTNQNLWNEKLETNTIYYIENIVKKYSYKNREDIRKTVKLKQELLVVLNFLIEKESVVGYMVREDIL